MGRNEEGSWKGSSDEAMGQHLFPILTPSTIPCLRPNTPVSFWQLYKFKLMSGMPLNTSMSPGAMG